MMVLSLHRSSINAFVAIAFVALTGCSSPPPLGDDPRAAKLADALMTAFAAKRMDLVDQGGKELDRLEQEKVLLPEVVKSFRNMMTSAHQGDWAGANAAIKAFILGQRK